MRLRRIVMGLAVAALAAVSVSTPVIAQDRSAEALGLEVVQGFAGVDSGAPWQPVEVRLSPTQPISGTLRVGVQNDFGGRSVAEIPLEVSAASREVHRVVVPRGSLRVDVVEAGVAHGVRVDAPPRTGDFVIGVLGEAVADPPPVRSEPTGRAGRWAPIDQAWAEESAQALTSLGTLVAQRSRLAELSEVGRANIAAAVAAGTDLVVVADAASAPGFADLALPWVADVETTGDTITAPQSLWRLTGADIGEGDDGHVIAVAAPAGYGRVVVTTVVPGDAGLGRSGALWSQLTGPASHLSLNGSQSWAPTSSPFAFARLLTDEDGAEPPRLPFLGLFVFAYVLVVGPLNGYLLFRMGRRELAWVTVPIITAVFTAGGFFGATGGRPPTGAVARLALWTDGAASEFVAAGARSARAGERTLALPGDDWTVRPLVDGVEPARVQYGTDTSVALQLSSLQLGGVAAWRTTTASPPIDVDIRASLDALSVSATNTGSRPLTDVEVQIAGESVAMADLEPGASETAQLGGRELPILPVYEEEFLPGDVVGGRGGGIPAPQSLQAALREFALDRPGLVWVTASDRQAPAVGVSAASAALEDRGTLVAVAEPVGAGSSLSPFAPRRDVLVGAGSFELFQPSPTALEGGGEAYLRFRLPPDAQGGDLDQQLERGNQGGVTRVTVWHPERREWQDLEDAFPPGDGQDRVVSPLGEVWVRVTGELFPFDFSARTIAGGS